VHASDRLRGFKDQRLFICYYRPKERHACIFNDDFNIWMRADSADFCSNTVGEYVIAHMIVSEDVFAFL
jgi:hypothetical protein